MKEYKKIVGTLAVLYFLAVLAFALLTMPEDGYIVFLGQDGTIRLGQ